MEEDIQNYSQTVMFRGTLVSDVMNLFNIFRIHELFVVKNSFLRFKTLSN